jgi:hypothetical protein
MSTLAAFHGMGVDNDTLDSVLAKL